MAKRIGSGDIEHYFGGVVMAVANRLGRGNLDALSHGQRQRRLNKAVEIVAGILNDDHNQEKLRLWLNA